MKRVRGERAYAILKLSSRRPFPLPLVYERSRGCCVRGKGPIWFESAGIRKGDTPFAVCRLRPFPPSSTSLDFFVSFFFWFLARFPCSYPVSRGFGFGSVGRLSRAGNADGHSLALLQPSSLPSFVSPFTCFLGVVRSVNAGGVMRRWQWGGSAESSSQGS